MPSSVWVGESVILNQLYVDATYYGAVGNGSTNDAAAIQRAVDAAEPLGAMVFLPNPTVNYYMGSTGLLVPAHVGIMGEHYTPLVWDDAFTGTAITLQHNYSILKDLILYKPKSVAPNAGILGIDIQGPLNVIDCVQLAQTSAGDHPGWYRGIRVSDISNTIRNKCEIYAFNTAIDFSGTSIYNPSRNDLLVEDTVATAEDPASGAVFHSLNASSLQLRDNDFECYNGSKYAIHIETTTVETAGVAINGGYIQGAADSGIYLNGNAAFPIRGCSINGVENNNVAGTNALRISNTVGCSVRGNYLKGLTNWLLTENTNTGFDEGGNFKSGARSIGGLFVPDSFSENVPFTPVLKFGGSAAGITGTFTGYWNKRGKTVSGQITIALTSKGAQVGAATITTAPFVCLAGYDGAIRLHYHSNLATSFVFEGYINNGSNVFSLGKGNNVTQVPVTDADFNNNSIIELMFEYETAS